MRKIFFFILCIVAIIAEAQNIKKVAILETVDKKGNVPYGVKLQVRSSLTYAISRTVGYEGYDRVDVSSITGEQNFQRTGMVSDTQIKKLGEMTGAQYVLIAEAALYDEQNIIITAKVLDVETGGIANSARPAIASKDPQKMEDACVKLAQTLLGGKNTYSSSNSRTSTNSSSYNSGQNYTETAWDIDLQMVWVEGGEFMMGCTSEQSNCNGDEQNLRRVTIDGFYIGMIEITQSQWEKVMGTSITQMWEKWIYYNYYEKWNNYSNYVPYRWGPSRGVGPNYPMYCVTWYDAMEFCNQLSQKTGKTYTLPTEAQWEYAARGGNNPDGTKYAGSNVIDAVAWYVDNSLEGTHPCGTKRPNGLGIYDMSGNVGEWCKDWYADEYITSEKNNPTGPSSGSYRVNRGGGWGIYASNCRVTHRDADDPSMRHRNLGFRVVCIP